MVDVSSFARFIPQSPWLQILTVEQHIFLKIFLQVKKMMIHTDFILEIIVYDIVDTAHPVRIARINQFVCSAIESSKLYLPLR